MEPLPNPAREPGWPSVVTGYLAIFVVKGNPSVQAALASPMSGMFPDTPMPPSYETQ